MPLIRAFNESDRDALRTIYKAARRAAYPWRGPQAFLHYDFDSDTLGECIYVALVDEIHAGFISIWVPDNFVHHLYVAPTLQRRGVGAALLNHSLRHCPDATAPAPTLKCLQSNVAALAFYRRQGWRCVGQGYSADGAYWLMKRSVL